MNAKTALLGLFVALTIVFASTTAYESGIRATTLTSTSTSTSTLTNTSTSTVTQTMITGIGTTTSIVSVQSQNPSVAITSTKLIVVTPDLCIIYNATVLNNSTKPVDNITMAFQNYTYHSRVTVQNALNPGQSTSFNFCYDNNDINTSSTEPPPLHLVLIYGTFEGNQPFAFIETIELAWINGVPV